MSRFPVPGDIYVNHGCVLPGQQYVGPTSYDVWVKIASSCVDLQNCNVLTPAFGDAQSPGHFVCQSHELGALDPASGPTSVHFSRTVQVDERADRIY